MGVKKPAPLGGLRVARSRASFRPGHATQASIMGSISIVMRVAAALLLAGSAAAAGTPSPARTAHLVYEVYIGGLHTVDLEIDLTLRGDGYELDLSSEVKGLLRHVLPWSLHTRSSGRVGAAGLAPETAHTESTWRGKRRWTTLEFRDGVPAIVSTHRKKDRHNVPADKLRGAIDAASAILSAARATESPESCSIRVPVFDGRTRFDAVFESFGEDELPRSRFSAYSGKAVVCDLGIEILHGRSKASDYGGLASGEKTMTFWFASLFDGVLPLPVRVHHDTDLGGVIGHLISARLSGDGDARTYRLPR